jgi:hypothetical protein
MELTYRAFGLTISSELPLFGLETTEEAPDVSIRRSPVPEWDGDNATIRYGDRFRIRGQQWSVHFKSLPFTGLIQDGNSVQFDADPAQDEMSSLHVLGSCTGALLFQRGLVPLHGNTVTGPDGAAMIVGRIGTGKSSTTFALLRRRYELVADDISPVSFDEEQPQVIPGFPRLKLWKSTLEHFGLDCQQFRRLRAGMDKYHYPVDDRFCATPQKLTSVYILQPRDAAGVRIRALAGLEKLDALRPHLYKIRFPDAIRNWPPLLPKMCRLADMVRVNIVERPRDGVSIEEVAEAIEHDLSDARQVRAFVRSEPSGPKPSGPERSRNAASGA